MTLLKIEIEIKLKFAKSWLYNSVTLNLPNVIKLL